MDKLRLVMFEECNRSCAGCCNKDWDLKALPSMSDYSAPSWDAFEEIFLTGGEPMLNPQLIVDTVRSIKVVSAANIYLYTAKSRRATDLLAIMHWVDGVTLTLHEQYDVPAFVELQRSVKYFAELKSLRLNVFSNVDISGVDTSGWEVKSGMEWIKDCPLPAGEMLMRL